MSLFRFRYLGSCILIVALLMLSGHYLFHRSRTVPRLASKPILQPIDWSAVDQATVEAAAQARQAAERVAGEKLDDWFVQLDRRAEQDFLPWYFGYWNQQVMGLKGLGYTIGHLVYPPCPDAEDQFIEEVRAQFSNRVLRPEVAQMELESIHRQVMDAYVESLRGALKAIPEKYSVPQGEWERYLADLSVLSSRVEGGRDVPLTLKAVYGSGMAGAVALGRPIKAIASRACGRLATASARKVGGSMATKVGAKLTARTGGKFLGPFIGAGVLAWDLWDHHHTRATNMPILRETIGGYCQQMRISLLRDPAGGIMTSIYEIEKGIANSCRTRSTSSST